MHSGHELYRIWSGLSNTPYAVRRVMCVCVLAKRAEDGGGRRWDGDCRRLLE